MSICCSILIIIYVVVQFYPWFNFSFLLFLGMVMYDNEFQTKENKNWIKDKIEPQHILFCQISEFFLLSHARIGCFLSVVDITWDGSGWLKGNVGQTGFYRINYMQQQWEQLSNQLDTDHQVGLMKMTPDFVLIGLTNLTALFSYHLCSFNVFRMVRYTKCFCVYKSISLY